MKKVVIFLLLSLLTINAQDVLDKIVAKVGDEIILKSELDMQANYFAIQRNVNPNDPKIREQLLNTMIEEKLLYVKAELDSIVVKDDEVDMQLDSQLNYFINQYGSREKVEEAYGMSIEKIRRELREDMRKNIMVQQIKQKNFSQVNVTRREVEEFYFTYKDSLGLIPEKFKLSHIFKNPKASEGLKQKIKLQAQELLDSIKNGGDFATLATELSEDPGSAKMGGDLGSVKRGVFFPEFEAAAFQLNPGELSEVIESPVGFHIIELLEKKGESIHTRHILLKIKPDDNADLKAIEFLTEVRDSIVRFNKSFNDMAEKFSDDKETSKFGGDLGILEVGQMEKSVLETVRKMEKNEISYPKRIQMNRDTYGYHIVKLIEHNLPHRANLENDFEELKKLAEYNKQQKQYEKMIKELKETVFWETRL
ncbi:MAG: peptidylprolyl isomerase [Melioribacteraceae bacterium]|nr:peptidylprolyl isomerase [Melioribacteraceae bacterium]